MLRTERNKVIQSIWYFNPQKGRVGFQRPEIGFTMNLPKCRWTKTMFTSWDHNLCHTSDDLTSPLKNAVPKSVVAMTNIPTWRFKKDWLQYVASNISNNPQFDKLIIESHGFWRMRDVGQVPPLAAPLGQPAHGEG